MSKKLKALLESREEKANRMQEIVDTVSAEVRAMSDEEQAEFDGLEQEVRAIDETVAREERARAAERPEQTAETEERAEAEERAFADYVLNRVSELRAGEQNLNMGNNGAIIPTSIANRIIKAVKDRCPILAGATIYRVKGNLKIPVWGDKNGHNIKVGFHDEFTELTADSGAFTSIDLGGFLAGALTLIGRSVENNAAFNVVDFIIDQMAEEIAIWIEGQLLNGTSGKNQGALETTNTVTAASATAITSDELIKLQSKIKQPFQANACWTMHEDTFTAIKQLKDNNGRYLMQEDLTLGFPYRLLGKPVYLSDNMPTIATGKKAILYGDYNGLAVNIRENMEIEVLREKYATMHAIGVVAWMEFDSKIQNTQKLATLTMA